MSETIDLEKTRKDLTVRKGFRNWKTRFGEDFGIKTRLADISKKALMMLAEGKDDCTFYLMDLIMNLRDLGSGFEFHERTPKEKMQVMDSYLFLLDLIRFEWMRRLGWLERFPGEEYTLVELVLGFEELAPRMQTHAATLSSQHPLYEKFQAMNAFQREELIRKLIPDAVKEIARHSTTL